MTKAGLEASRPRNGPKMQESLSYASIDRHLGNPRPVALSRAALEVLAIVAYRQPIARAGIEAIRGSVSDSALDTLFERGLVGRNAVQLLVTTRAFLEFAALRDLTDLPPLGLSPEDAFRPPHADSDV